MILAFTAFYIEAKPRGSTLDGLEKYLNQKGGWNEIYPGAPYRTVDFHCRRL